MIPLNKSYLTVQRQLSRKVKGIKYVKYVIVINNDIIREMNWNKNTVLLARINEGKLILKKVIRNEVPDFVTKSKIVSQQVKIDLLESKLAEEKSKLIENK